MTAARTEEKGHIREGDALFAFVGYTGGSGVETKKWSWVDLRQENLQVTEWWERESPMRLQVNSYPFGVLIHTEDFCKLFFIKCNTELALSLCI